MLKREEIAALSLKAHREAKGKLFTGSKVPVETMDDLSGIYPRRS